MVDVAVASAADGVVSPVIPGGSLRRGGSTPLYVQIRDRLTAAIRDGELSPGARLPSEPELVDLFGVGRPTVRQAIAVLRQEGWVVTRRGLGTFVTGNQAEVSLLGFDGLTRSLHARGLALRDEIIETTTWEHPPFEVLQLDGPGPWWAAVRLRRLVRDGAVHPLCVESDYFPLQVCPRAPDLFAATGSATVVLAETYGFAVASCEVASRAVVVPAQWRSALALPARAPVLAMERVNRGADGLVLHAASFVFRTDLVPLVEHLFNPALARG